MIVNVAVKCPVDRCEYRLNVTDAALAATLLTIHAQSQHVDTSAPSRTAGATAKVEKISRPTVDEGISLEDWLYFEQRWREYKDATRVAGSDLGYQLLDCCNPEGLRKNLARVHRDALASCSERDLLAFIKKLAVRAENTMVARDVLSKMRQDRDEPVRVYSARLKGQARVCQFVIKCQCPSCPNHDACVGADYSDIVVRDQVILGCADHDIKLDCLIEKGPSTPLEEVEAFVEGKESGKISLQQLSEWSEAAAPISSFRKQQRAVFKQHALPPLLPTPLCTHCGQIGNGSSRDERSDNCPAYGQTCTKCGKQGHLGTVCRKKSTAGIHYVQRRPRRSPQRETATAGERVENAPPAISGTSNCSMGVFEEVPTGTPVTWCHRMVIGAKKNGKPRRTVDLQALNASATRETYHTQRPFHQARSVPRGTKKTASTLSHSTPTTTSRRS